jgi:sigma-B regulation protein RsbU (phosphoserine phosphatase)
MFLIQTTSESGLNKMKFEDSLKTQILKLDMKNPQYAFLLKQALEYWATLKDNGINNQLLQDIVFKYSVAEKKLKQLNQELLDKQKRLDEDLVAAAEIQQSLLPQKIDSAENLEVAWEFEPCERMGGDIFNMFQLDDDHWGIYMLDVSGHSVQAAMVTVSVSQFLQLNSGHLLKKKSGKSATTRKLKSPADVLVALDTEFPFERFNNFFTIAYLIINTQTGEVRYSNAGHPHSIVLRKNGTLELLRNGGPAIGVGDFHLLSGNKNRFEEGQAQMNPGDKLFVYTDGIIEYENLDGKLYGTDRFYEALKSIQGQSVTDIVGNSVKSLMDFGNNAKPQDDITLLGLEFKKSDR